MRKIGIIMLAVCAVSLLIYAGITGLQNNYAIGPFFTFVGCCSAIGLGIDISKQIRQHIQKEKLRKLRP